MIDFGGSERATWYAVFQKQRSHRSFLSFPSSSILQRTYALDFRAIQKKSCGYFIDALIVCSTLTLKIQASSISNSIQMDSSLRTFDTLRCPLPPAQHNILFIIHLHNNTKRDHHSYIILSPNFSMMALRFSIISS